MVRIHTTLYLREIYAIYAYTMHRFLCIKKKFYKKSSEINKLLISSKPTWSKLKHLNLPYFHDLEILITLTYLIFTDLEEFNRFVTAFSNNLFFQEDVFQDVTKPRLKSRLKRITNYDLELCYNYGLLADKV